MPFRNYLATNVEATAPNDTAATPAKRPSLAQALIAIAAIHLLLVCCAIAFAQYPREASAIPAPEEFSNGMPLP